MFLTPLNHDDETLAKALCQHKDFVWLDSNGQDDFSLMAWNAVADFKTFREEGAPPLARFLAQHPLSPAPVRRQPARLKFLGGWIGYFAYEAFALNPLIPFTPSCLPDYPLAHWRYYDTFVYFDHAEGKTWFASLSPNAETLRRDLLTAAAAVESRRAAIYGASYDADPGAPFSSPLIPRVSRTRYDADFASIKSALARGDYFELNYTIGFDADFDGNPFDLYLALRQTAQAPQMAFWRDATFDALCASPECFFRIHEGAIETFPVKGTAARGRTPVEDTALKDALADNPKERAELLMVTDMLRNDLGRVCGNGPVATPLAVGVGTFAQCHHLYSVIRGDLRRDVTLADVFNALFPGGSITGAPKIQVMRDIDRIEARARGIYTGAIGLISTTGFTEFNIPIRTLILKERRIEYAAGGGIVADSACSQEYAECLLKTNIVATALARVGGRVAA